jgi:hypothetical protein
MKRGLLKNIAVLSVTLASLSLQGCLVAAIGSGVGAWKWGDAKKAEAETQCKKEYPNYYTGMEKINNTKRAHHEKTDPIMTLNEYCHIEVEEKKVVPKNEVKK